MSTPTGPPPGPDHPRPTGPPPDADVKRPTGPPPDASLGRPTGPPPSGPPPTVPSAAAPPTGSGASGAEARPSGGRRSWIIGAVVLAVLAVVGAVAFLGGSDDKAKTGTSDVVSDDLCDRFEGVVSQEDVTRYLSGEADRGGPVSAVAISFRAQVDNGTLGTCTYTFEGQTVTISLRRPTGDDLRPTGSEEALGGLGDAAVYDTASPRVSVLDRSRDVVLSVSYPGGFAVKTKLAMLTEFVLRHLPPSIG